jgi:hypothetical protein
VTHTDLPAATGTTLDGRPPAAARAPGRTTLLVGLGVLLVALWTYLRTMSPTVPFWDAGEFIAVSKILGIPHPPGTPLYVLLGRMATLVPLGSIAQRVNGLSAVAAALAVLLTYLTTLRLIRIAQRRGIGEGAGREWLAQVGAVVAALMLAFSRTFWSNATGAETYAPMSLAQVLILWLGLRWWEAHDRRPTAGPLLVAVYVMWLSVGLMLGVGMMGLPLMVLLWLVDRRVAVLFALPMLSVLGVTFGLEKMVGLVLGLAVGVYWYYAWERKLSGWVALLATAGALVGLYYALGRVAFTPLAAWVTVLAVVVPAGVLARRHREGRILALALLLMVVGYSTHLYLPIRAAQRPAINMGNPSSGPALKALLEREQYGRNSMFVRRGTPASQLDKEFWRYWKRQWPLGGTLTDDAGIPVQGEPRLWQVGLPLLVGLLGAGWQARRERVTFLTMLSLFLFATVGMILFLNFSDQEVRDRDYFFTTGYHAFALWLGLGVVFLAGWIGESFPAGWQRRLATGAAVALLAVQPALVARSHWYASDNEGNRVARDYAHNMLAPLAPNSFLFTNGDNDTYPLWYIQQVEGFRTDVRVVCLALLQTDWYIFQLRDEEPKVPIALSDDDIRAVGIGYVRDESGGIMATNSFMVHHILGQARRDTGWVKQPYFAVTAPDHRGYDRYLTLEGMVYRVNPDTLRDVMDVPVMEENLYRRFLYRGLFLADGSWDRGVFKDESAVLLTRNYASAHAQLAMRYHARRDLPRAIAEMERVQRMFPGFTSALVYLGQYYLESGDTTRATGLLRDLVARRPDDPQARFYHGVTLAYRGDLEGALREYDEAIRLAPDYADPYYFAYSLLGRSGRLERAVGYLQRLVQVSPQEQEARELLRQLLPQLGRAAPGMPGPSVQP